MVEAVPIDALPGRSQASGVPEELSELLETFRTRPGTWFRIGSTLEVGGTNSNKHRLRAKYMKVLRREGIEGYEFTVREGGRSLYGRKK